MNLLDSMHKAQRVATSSDKIPGAIAKAYSESFVVFASGPEWHLGNEVL